MMAGVAFQNDQVEAAFAAFSASGRDILLAVRAVIFEVAAADQAVGPLNETLKWGQPAYQTLESGSGTTIRLGLTAKQQPALFVHCATTLIADFKNLYGNTLKYEGKRALLVTGPVVKADALPHCVLLALTYHSRKKRRAI